MDAFGGQDPDAERTPETEETVVPSAEHGGWQPPTHWGPAAWTPPGEGQAPGHDPYGGGAPYGTGAPYAAGAPYGASSPYGTDAPYGPAGGGYPPVGGYGFYPNPTPGPEEPVARRRSHTRAIAAGSIAAAVILAGVAGGVVGHSFDSQAAASGGTTPTSSGSTQSPSTYPSYGGGSTPDLPSSTGGSGNSGSANSGSTGSGTTTATGPSDASALAAKVDPGLVDIDTVVDYGEAEAAGTGMVLTSTGEILTNNHVIDGATSIKVTDVGNGRSYSATVVGYDLTQDVAVIQLENASGLRTITASRTSVAAGNKVVGIGNAGGKGGTPSYAGGSVTATDRAIIASDELTGNSEHLSGLIATNADIEAGDSGGPLVNTSGQVVGMDTAGSGNDELTSAASSTEGFAIPIGEATSLAREIEASEASGTVHVGTTAFLGVEISASGEGAGSEGGFGGDPFGSPNSGGSTSTSGVEISGTVSGSPAASAGLTGGDTITSVAGHSVSSEDSLQQVMVSDVRPGQTIAVTYVDSSGQSHSVEMTLTSGPPA